MYFSDFVKCTLIVWQRKRRDAENIYANMLLNWWDSGWLLVLDAKISKYTCENVRCCIHWFVASITAITLQLVHVPRRLMPRFWNWRDIGHQLKFYRTLLVITAHCSRVYFCKKNEWKLKYFTEIFRINCKIKLSETDWYGFLSWTSK